MKSWKTNIPLEKDGSFSPDFFSNLATFSVSVVERVPSPLTSLWSPQEGHFLSFLRLGVGLLSTAG